MTMEGSYVQGIVLKAEPMNEYDRRVVLLTKERGKISAFAKYSRKPGNKLMAPTNPFSFGEFKLFEGRNSYTIQEADITNYFEHLRTDFEGAYYGMYFLELSDYYTRENLDGTQQLKLLYQALRALGVCKIPKKLVRCIFELKSIDLNGEYQEYSNPDELLDTTKYTIDYILHTPVEKLFSFTIEEKALEQLTHVSKQLCHLTFDRTFKSLEILENIN